MWGRMRQIWMPSNHKALLASQEALLSQFNSTRLWSKSVAVGDGDVINYVDSLYEDGSKSSDGRSLANTNRRTTKHGIDSVQSDIPLVMLHGYGSGLGFFFRNYDAMCAKVPRVLGVDWLGMGGSSRPRRCSLPPRVPLLCRGSFSERQAIDFFTDALEKWRESVGLDRFHLLGHSLGGYLVAQYALKYPERVESLTMASPAGIAHPPAPRQILSDQGQSVSPPALPLSLRLIDAAWANNVTPQQLIRMFGRRGPGLTLSAVKRRFGAGRFSESDARLIADYLYQITAAPASGEYALNSLLKPVLPNDMRGAGVYALLPLEDDLAELKPIPTHLIYGDNDWLFHPSIPQLARQHQIGLTIVPKAGHHLYLDNPDVFNRAVLQHIYGDRESR